MNAPRDFSLEKAVKKVGQVLNDNPAGLQISQITGMARLSTKTTKLALNTMEAVEYDGLWFLPLPQVIQEEKPALKVGRPTKDATTENVTELLLKKLKANPEGILSADAIEEFGCAAKTFYSSLRFIRLNHFPVDAVKGAGARGACRFVPVLPEQGALVHGVSNG